MQSGKNYDPSRLPYNSNVLIDERVQNLVGKLKSRPKTEKKWAKIESAKITEKKIQGNTHTQQIN